MVILVKYKGKRRVCMYGHMCSTISATGALVCGNDIYDSAPERERNVACLGGGKKAGWGEDKKKESGACTL